MKHEELPHPVKPTQITHSVNLNTQSQRQPFMTDQPATITITLKLFAIYQETVGVPEQQLTLPAGTPVSAVRDRLIAEHPSLAEWKDLTRFGLNLQFVEADTLLQNGDELVLIPPVSGG